MGYICLAALNGCYIKLLSLIEQCELSEYVSLHGYRPESWVTHLQWL